MPALSENEAIFLGTVLEFFFYGFYCVVFYLYIRIMSKGGPARLRYPIISLFVLSTSYICLDFASEFITIFRPTSQKGAVASYGFAVANDAIYSFIDVISQGVLIYRCWVMWNNKLSFIILPSCLAATSFVLAMSVTIKYLMMGPTDADFPAWWFKVALASFSISLCVNAVVTSLLVFKIVCLHRSLSCDGPPAHGSYKLRPLISAIVESGMFTLMAQTLWVVFVQLETVGNPGFAAVVGPTTIVYGITPTIVLVRSAMGRSYDTTVMDGTIEFKVAERSAEINNFSIMTGCSQVSSTAAGEKSCVAEQDVQKQEC